MEMINEIREINEKMNKVGTQRIETPRLILRRVTIEDAKDMYDNWASDPEVTRFLTWPTHTDIEVTRYVVNLWVEGYKDGDNFNWVIEYKDTGKAIGAIAAVKVNEDIDEAVIGYCLGRAFWGQGLMPEALKAVMDYLFDVAGMNRVAAYHAASNAKSGRVMQKAGMKYEGTLRASKKSNSGIEDVLWYSMIRSDRDSSAELSISLEDYEWPLEYIDHDRQIARAIVFDDDGYLYFVRAQRDDDFGKVTTIETAGGGVEKGEDPDKAILRELKEELGVDAGIVTKIGVVSDYYNRIHRHNLNNYYLCKIESFGTKELTQDEIEKFHLSTLKLTYEEAVAEYEKCRDSSLGRLLANRELPVLKKARELMDFGKQN